jgi:hypothetical protein
MEIKVAHLPPNVGDTCWRFQTSSPFTSFSLMKKRTEGWEVTKTEGEKFTQH